MEALSIAELKQQAGDTPLEAAVEAQLQKRVEKRTKKGDPYLEFTLADAGSSFALKAWSNHRQFSEISELSPGCFVRIEGRWTQNQYGLDSGNWHFRELTGPEAESLLTGDSALEARQRADWDYIANTLDEIADPRLRGLARLFVEQFGERYRRAAAAKKNHHARRGGLVEHVAQMMRSALAICSVYPELNRDLLIAGVLFHDCGKIWENNYPETGFAQNINLHGEMLGHIPLGIELVNKLWRELLESPDSSGWIALEPKSEDVRLHLLHLIASHHGEYAFGSPTLPRTAEAFALHHIDNLDAKLEMIREAYTTATEVTPGIYERQFPLPAPLVRPLATMEGDTPNVETAPSDSLL